ncbi:aldose 1-epimerase [Paenibacillus shirakamiensis]|uniref:Aldose 1-epimerase n=1 Tax=Paenibacillus shirakamiensis TaxID=1265935 RepID=A0ABS4JHL8_9BACL|nr:aldose 1-epimerase [Paenibacillus shirakamiensis]MBP2001214.1 aldose 1-epimerase [Paenibacillus shirakamiensis]
MGKIQAFKDTYGGESAIRLTAGLYEAVILPEYGGNLVAFRDTIKGWNFLREPEHEMEMFKQKPAVYGIPVLFPPNRYEDGQFPWDGQTYELSINEPDRHNHLHGFLHTTPWEIEDFGTTQHHSYVTVSITVNEQHPVYAQFPFQFTMKLQYTLGADGLSQRIWIHNDGDKRLPCLLAFHTAINAPFIPGSQASNYQVKLTVGERWEMNERMLPTGRKLPVSPTDHSLREGTLHPFSENLDHHYTVAPQNGRNRMELTDTVQQVTLVYDVGTSYKQWMIYNNEGTPGFFCPEPQVNLVNAPNISLPAEEIGLFGLECGEIWEETARIYIK